MAFSFGRLDELLPRLFPEFDDQNRLFATYRDGDTNETWLTELMGSVSEATGGNS